MLKLLLKSYSYLFHFLVCFAFLFVSYTASAQTDPNDPSSPNYKGKNKGVVQKQSKFSGSLGASFGRGFDQYDESFGSYSFSGNYALTGSSITVNAGYNHPLDGDTDNVRDRAAGWMFDDVDVIWNAPMFKPLKIGSRSVALIPRLTYRVPLSFASQDSGSYGTVVGTLIGSTNVGRFNFILSPRVNLSYHAFETADKAGFIKNSPLAAMLVGAIRMTVLKNLFLTGTAFAYHGWDYDFNSIPVTGLSSNVYYQMNKRVGLTAFVSWRDRVFTNNSFFDDDASTMGLGIITSF